MPDILNNIAICVFTFYETKMRYNLLNTTDVNALKNELYYSQDKDPIIAVGRRVTLKSETGKEKNYKIAGIEIHYFNERIMNRNDLVGDKHDYNVQSIVWVEAE